MRFRTGLAAALLMLLPVAGCARGPGGDDGVASASTAKPSASATDSAPHNPKDDQESSLRYAQCMRDHGIPMDDPNFEGNGISIMIPEGTDKSKVDAANAECKQYMPNGGQPPKLDPAQAEQLRKFSQCMRDHGIKDFPDPQDNGGLMIDGDKLGIDPRSQPFKDAEKACEQYQPKPKGGEGAEGGDGPQTQEHAENGGATA
ncbi:hypothetical protein [Dactylosporangium sp. CA-139066]|uniref:hypothetical protein n=1 Tax=Dactylosporangium sp. CA-139066 TaxID=3239930 RepID=UPI003D918B8F